MYTSTITSAITVIGIAISVITCNYTKKVSIMYIRTIINAITAIVIIVVSIRVVSIRVVSIRIAVGHSKEKEQGENLQIHVLQHVC